MGFHICKYITPEEAKQRGLRNADVVYSSGDVTMTFSSGNRWEMPDMARLYVELGWVPPQAFINDIMTGELVSGGRRQTRGMQHANKIGYLDAKETPLPLTMSDQLPAGFLEKMEEAMKKAASFGYDGQSCRRQTKGTAPKI